MKNAISISVLLLTSAFGFAQGEQMIDKIMAIVGDEIVLYSDIQSQKAQMVQQGIPETADMDCLVVEELLMQNLLLNQAKIDSLEVTEEEIQSNIDRRLAYFISLVGSEDQFEAYYGKTIPQYREDFYEPIRDQLLAQRMQEKINSEAQVTPSEVREYFSTIPEDSLPLINESIMYSKIVIEPEVDQAARNAERAFLDSIRTEVVNGGLSMFTAAAIHSEDPGSKYKGGCYEEIRKGQFDPAYEAAVYKTRVGEFSPVFESTFGFHFVQVKEIRGESFSSCHVLRIPKIKEAELERSRLKLDSIHQVLKTDSISFELLATRHSTDEESANAGGVVIDPQTGDTRHEVRGLDPKLFFALDKLELEEFTEPILVSSDDGNSQSYVVYRLDKRLPAHVANLKDDYQLIQTAAQGDKRNNLLDTWVGKQLDDTYVKIEDDAQQGCEFEYNWVSLDKAEKP